MIFGCSFGIFELGVNGQLYKKYPDVLFEQATGTQIKKNQSEYFGAGEDTIYLSGMAAGAAIEEGPDRLRRPLRHPRGRAPHQRVHARRPGDASGGEGQADLDELLVLAAEGGRGREELDRRGRRRASARTSTVRQAGVVAESKGIPWVGYDSNARKSAPKQWLTAATYNWGPYYVKRVKAAINGTWKPGLLLRLDQGRLHGYRSVRPEGQRRRRRPRSQPSGRRWSRASSTSSRADLTTRRARSWSPRGRPSRSSRICTRCSGSSRA